MNDVTAIIGLGEIGGVFARGLLKIGHPVYPITRQINVEGFAQQGQDMEAVIVAVGEKDLHPMLKQIPEAWYDKLVLVQNELLPTDWKSHNINNPTVISVWFEKKQPNDFKVIIPSPVYGPKSNLVETSLKALGIPCKILNNEDELLFELVLKNLYILTVNIAGLQVGGNVEQLWKQHELLARNVANDVLDIQFGLIGKELDREALIDGMVEAFAGDWAHKCMGRSAPARLERAIAQADEVGLPVSSLREIQQHHSVK